MMAYCWDILEAKEMSTAIQDVYVSQSYVPCLSMVKDVRHLRWEEARDITRTKAARGYMMEKDQDAALQIAQESRRGY